MIGSSFVWMLDAFAVRDEVVTAIKDGLGQGNF